MPAPQFINITSLKFQIIKQDNLTAGAGKKPIYFAKCLVCNSNLRNTALERLKGHRRVCSEERAKNGLTSRDRSRSPLNKNQPRQNGQPSSPLALLRAKAAAGAGANHVHVSNLTEQEFMQEEFNVDNDLINYIVDPTTGELIPCVLPPTPSTSSTSSITANVNQSPVSLLNISTSTSDHRSSSSSLSTISPSCITPSDSASCVENNIENIVVTPRIKKQKKKQKSMNEFVDTITDEEVAELNILLGNCFFGCNFAFSAVQSDHFRKFIEKLRPAYAEKMPDRKTLSTTILDMVYNKCLENVKTSMDSENTLLIDGWKNSSNNSKLVVSMLHSANGDSAFVDAYDFTTESETGDNLVKVVEMSQEKVKELYNTDIVAVVSDNAANMLKMGRNIPQYHINCNAHTGNLLAKDLNDERFTKKVVSVLKEFKSHPGLEKKLIENGGKRIELPVDTRWCTYRDSYENLKYNWTPMKKVLLDNQVTIKADIKAMLIDDIFYQEVQDYINLFDPVCKLINSAQSSDTSIADSTAKWLELNFEGGFDHLNVFVTERRNMALNKYGLTAFYLHPKYHQEKLHLLNAEHMKEITSFLIDELGEEYADVVLFVKKKSIFTKLYQNNVSDVKAFWMAASSFHYNLSNLAMRLNSIPASSAQLERVFSQWSFVHNPLRNRLTFDKSKKLIHVYYSLKIRDKNKSDEY